MRLFKRIKYFIIFCWRVLSHCDPPIINIAMENVQEINNDDAQRYKRYSLENIHREGKYN
jgi:hypothetical protein